MSRLSILMMAGALAAFAIPAAAETVVIINAHILTAGPRGEIASGLVMFTDGKITDVGDSAMYPTAARIIDAHGAYVTPGFFATGSELGGVEVGGERRRGWLHLQAGVGELIAVRASIGRDETGRR